MAKTHHPALHGACPDTGKALLSPVWGGSGGRAPLGHCWVSGSRAQKHLTSAVLGQVPAGASLG